MNDATLIDELIGRWEIAQWSEQPIEVEDLCRDRPELIEQVKAIIDKKTILDANPATLSGSQTDELLPFAEEVSAKQPLVRNRFAKESRALPSPNLVAEPIVRRSPAAILLVLLVCSLVGGATGIYWTYQNAKEMEQMAAEQARIAQEKLEIAGKNAEEVLERTRERDAAKRELLRSSGRDKSQEYRAQQLVELKQQNRLLESEKEVALNKLADLVEERDQAVQKQAQLAEERDKALKDLEQQRIEFKVQTDALIQAKDNALKKEVEAVKEREQDLKNEAERAKEAAKRRGIRVLPRPKVPYVGLSFYDRQFKDDDLLWMLDHTAAIGELNIRGNWITDKGFVTIGKLTRLRQLDASRLTELTDSGLANLSGLKELKSLTLYNTRIGDEGIVHLRELTKLEELHLLNTRITDAALEQLEKLPSLKWVNVQETKVTPAGIEKFRKAKPGVKLLTSFDKS